MEILLLSLLLLVAAPFCYGILRRFGEAFVWFDRVVFLIVAGLVVIELLPVTVEQIGWLALALALLGWWVPSIFEKYLTRLDESVHMVPMILAFVGIVIHGFVDGAGLTGLEHPGGAGHEHALPMAVILHRLPVSIFIWMLLYPKKGWPLPTAVLTMIGLSTIAGFAFGEYVLVDWGSNEVMAGFQAVVAGSLLHLATHDRSAVDHGHHHAEH